MNSDEQISELERFDSDDGDALSVDDFIRQLEEREKDLHITADTTVIEIAEGFEDSGLPDLVPQELQTTNPVTSAAKQAPERPAADPSLVSRLELEVAELKTRIARMEEERDEILENAQRRARDFETFKSRTERERSETFQNQISSLAVQMLPALDNLHRALDFACAMPDEKQVGVREFIDGVMLVGQQVGDVLDGMGIQPITAVGEEFDPHLHEAVATEETEEYAEGIVCAEVLRGYRLGDRVVRHSIVKVAKAPPGRSGDAAEDSTV